MRSSTPRRVASSKGETFNSWVSRRAAWGRSPTDSPSPGSSPSSRRKLLRLFKPSWSSVKPRTLK